jgi:hypothetical protein
MNRALVSWTQGTVADEIVDGGVDLGDKIWKEEVGAGVVESKIAAARHLGVFA